MQVLWFIPSMKLRSCYSWPSNFLSMNIKILNFIFWGKWQVTKTYIISFRLFTLHKSIIVKKYILKKPDSPINGQVSAIRHVPIPTCSISSLFYHAVFIKNLNEHEVCLSMPLMRYLSQLLYWHNVYNRVRIGFWWRIFLSIASLFFNLKKKSLNSRA